MKRALSPGKLVLLCFLCLGAGCSSPILDVSRQAQLIQYQQEIEDAVVKSEWLSMQKIGVEPYSSSPLLKITYRPTHPRYRVLITAGMHGDEPAGVEAAVALIRLLASEQKPKVFSHVAIDLVPWVNPWGFQHLSRENAESKDINRDFNRLKTFEAASLVAAVESQHYDVALDLHESSDDDGFMVFTYQGVLSPDPIVQRLIEAGYPVSGARTNRRYANGVETLRAPTSGATYSWSQRMIVTHQPLISWTLESPDQWPESRRVAFHMAAVEQAIALYTEAHDVLNRD